MECHNGERRALGFIMYEHSSEKLIPQREITCKRKLNLKLFRESLIRQVYNVNVRPYKYFILSEEDWWGEKKLDRKSLSLPHFNGRKGGTEVNIMALQSWLVPQIPFLLEHVRIARDC